MAEVELGEILLVEDNPGDVLLTQKALERAKILDHLQVVRDGEAALEYLKRVGQEGYLLPHLILLDISLPKVSGLEVLSFIKHDPVLRRIPVVMLSGSEADRDVAAAYDLHANSFITKPLDPAKLASVLSDMKHYWFAVVRRPEPMHSD